MGSSFSGKAKVNDLNMYYEFAGEGETVVLIAGLASDHLEWLPFHVPAFTAAGFRCLIFDNRDVGLTGESATPVYTIQTLAEDTAGLLKHLDVKRAHIMGESMGGMIAQELAIGYPELVQSLTLICTAGDAEPYLHAISVSWKNIRRKLTLEESFQSFGLWFYSSRFYENPENEKIFLEEVRANPHPQTVAGFERQWDAILTHNTLDRLNRIVAHTHVIAGEDDIIFPLRFSQDIAQKILGSKLSVFSGLGHVLAFESPDEFNPIAIDFLKQHSEASRSFGD
jgi:pimeloyl-ACP methyl ester carboxylesterase